VEKIYDSIDWSANCECTHLSKVGSDCITCAIGQYYEGRIIDYSCDQLRNLYLLRYFLVHLREIYSIFERLLLSKCLPKWPHSAKVLSIGGGPGSDIAGFKHFLTTYGFYSSATVKFEFTRLDRVTEWDSLASSVYSLFDTDSFQFSYSKIHADLRSYLNHPLIFPIVKSMPSRSMGNRLLPP